MDGGRGAGGGRGKGKKGKVAKKKAAANAQVASSAASRNKVASTHHGGKKVGANHANVQVVAIPKASTTHAAHNEAKITTEQTMTKSKRKRLKKKAAGATNALLKKQAVAEIQQQAKKSPTAAAASATSPKTAVLTPPAAAAATAKPHVVSLTAVKKRKRQAALKAAGSEAGNDPQVVATTLTASNDEKTSPPVVKTKKTVVLVGHSGMLASGATKTVATVACPKLKIAQVGILVQKPQIQTAASAASPKNETTRVNKVKAKPEAIVAAAIPPATVAAPKGVSAIQQETGAEPKKPAAVTNLSKLTSDPSKAGVVKQTPETVQVKEPAKKLPTVRQAPPASNPLKSKTAASLVKSEDATTSKTITATTAVSTKSASIGKPAPPNLKLSKTRAEVADADTSAIDKKNALPVPESSIANNAGAAKRPTSSVTEDTSNVQLETQAMVSAKLSPSTVANEKVSSPGCGLKRRRSTEPASANSTSDTLQPPVKRSAASSKIAVTQSASSQTSSSSKTLTDRSMAAVDWPQPVEAAAKVNDTNLLPVATSTAANKSTAETKTRSAQTPDPTPKVPRSTTKTLKATIKAETSPVKVQEGNQSSTSISTENTGKEKKVGIIMDSRVYVQQMMKGESTTSNLRKRRDTHHTQSTDLEVASPTCPQNSWGASFGMVPTPAQDSSFLSQTLTTTPLSSWFLSKGCANFVKHVHFSDEDDHSSSDDDGVSNGLVSNAGKALPKKRASVAKKNSFLESLTAQSYWRSWYGNVDMHNLLDPPLAYLPGKLRSHEVTPLALPEMELVSSVTSEKAGELEMLEADIRREKQRSSAFSEQLLMMLQGKTVSGKLLEEEYQPLLNH